MFDGLIILVLGVILHMLRKKSISMYPTLGSSHTKIAINANIKGIYLNHVATVQLSSTWVLYTSIPTKTPVLKSCAINIILLTLWF